MEKEGGRFKWLYPSFLGFFLLKRERKEKGILEEPEIASRWGNLQIFMRDSSKSTVICSGTGRLCVDSITKQHDIGVSVWFKYEQEKSNLF